MKILISKSIEQDEWVGVIDIEDIHFSQAVFDKPLVYYLLSHFFLFGINAIHVLTSEKNREFLSDPLFGTLGFKFVFDNPENGNLMVLSHPWFPFGADMTQQFQGAMISRRTIKLVPDNQEPVFFFAYSSEKYNRKKYRGRHQRELLAGE